MDRIVNMSHNGGVTVRSRLSSAQIRRPIKGRCPLTSLPLLLLALAALSLSAEQLAAQPGRIVTVGYYDAKPSCFRGSSGLPAGIFIDVIEAIARRQGWRLQYRFATWDELLEGLRNGTVDLVPAIVRTPQRESFAIITDESVMSDWGTVFGRAGGGLSSILDLDRREIGALENDFWFSGHGSLKELCSSFNVHPVYRFFPDYPSLFEALGRGTITGAVGSNSLGIVWAHNEPIVATSIVYNPIELRFAAPRSKPESAALVQELDKSLSALRSESPEVLSSALAKYEVPLGRERFIPRWLIVLLASTSLVLVAVVVLLAIQRRAIRTNERRLWNLFEESPLSIWEEDFSQIKRRIDLAKANGGGDWNEFFSTRERVLEFVSLIRILNVNRATLDLLGYERKSDLGSGISRPIHEEEIRTFRDEFIALATGKLTHEGESIYINTTGEQIFTHFKLCVLQGYEQTWSRVLVSILNISRLKRTEETLRASLAEKELLLREVHHRVKNNLQIICSLINLQMGDREDPSASGPLVDMESRVRAMSLVHETLYQSENFAEVDLASYISRLCSHLIEAYAIDGRLVRIITDLDEIDIPLEKAIPCGLLLNELVSNALKHAFPAGRTGTVNVALRSTGESGISLSVSDDGIGIPDPDAAAQGNRRSIGLKLVSSLVSQLGGEYKTESRNGVTAYVVFPK